MLLNYLLNRECEMAFQVDYPKGRHQNELCSIGVVVCEGQVGCYGVGDLSLHQTCAGSEVRKKNNVFLVCLGTWFESVSGWGLKYMYISIYIYTCHKIIIFVHNTISCGPTDIRFSTQGSYWICAVIKGWVSECKRHIRYFYFIFF